MSGGREPRKRKLSGEGQDELSGGKRPSIDLENMDLTDPDFLELYQKDAIWREMEVYRMRLAVSQQESEQGRRKMIELQKCLSVLHSAWKSFQDGLLSATESSTNVESIDALLGEILKGSVEDDATDKLAGQMQKTVASLLGGLSGKLAHLGAQDTIQKLLQRESTLLLELNRIKSDIISADAQIKEWESKHARLEEQLVHAERKLLRERSKVAKKAFDVPESSTKESKEEASQETQICSSSQLSNAESKTSMNIDQTVLEEYDEKLKMFQVLAEGRLTQLQKSEQERATLQRQVDKYASEIQCLPESALQDVPAYKELFEKFDTFQHQLDSKKAEIEQLYVETNELKTSRRIYQEAIQNDEQNYKGVLESEISKLTQDLTRIRANRDSFVSKMEKFQQKLKSTEHNYELAKEKLDFFNQRIVILLEENRRLKKDIASRTGDAEFYKDAVLACEIIQPEDGVPSLKGLYATLKEKELSLRQNDTIDDANHEFVTVRNKLEHYEKVLGSDVNAENLSKRLEERLLSLEIAELRLKNYEEAQAGLLAEIEVISESFTNLEKKESEKDKVIQDKDEEIQRLLSEKHKIEQRMALLVKEKDSLNNKHIALGKQSSKQNEYIKKLEAEKRAKEFTLVNLEKELEDSKLVAKKHEETAQDTLRQLHVLTKKLEVYDRRHVDVNDVLQQKEAQIEEHRLKELEISEENKKLQTRLEYLEKRVPGTGSSEDDPVVVNLKQQVEDLLLFKKVSQCNVCNFRLKKFVILRCMHVFCQNCVEERLESRQRRCPECGINFGQGDVKQIYI